MRFENSEFLMWIPLIVLGMLATLWFHKRWRTGVVERLGQGSALPQMFASFCPRRRAIRNASFILAALFMAIAVAQPQWGQTNHAVKRTGVDIVFAIDISKSMLARDVAPSRLEAARAEIKTVLQELGGDRVALVMFTAISFAQSPLTTDYGAIRFYLDKMDPNAMPVGGTSLGRAISDSVALLIGKGSEESDGPQMKRAKSQVIILISDGEDHESDPLAAAEHAREHGIKIISLGIGSKSGDRIPVLRADGTQAGFQRDRKGEIVRSRLDEAMLQEIAARTGGEYIYYEGQNSAANSILSFVDRLEQSELETLMKDRYRERYHFFLFPALLLLLLGTCLSERKKSAVSKIVLAMTAAFLWTGCDDAFRAALSEVDVAQSLLESGDAQGALERLERAESKVPANPELHYNLGTVHLALGKLEDAQTRLSRALESSNPERVFDATVNLGLVLAARERWKEAYETFQDALIIASESGVIAAEKVQIARHNLEVAFEKLYPPCSELDDEYEDNDEPLAATNLETLEIPKGVICSLDDDWFRIPALPGTRVSVSATFTPLRTEIDDEVPFIARPEDIQLSLFSHDASTVLAVDQGTQEDVDSAKLKLRASRSIERLYVDEEALGNNSHILLKIASAPGREYRYSAKIETIPPCFALQEASEPNNEPEEAGPLNIEGPQAGHLCPTDADWYTFSIRAGDSFFVDLQAGEDAERQTAPNPTLQIIRKDTLEILSEGVFEAGLLTAGVRSFSEDQEILIRVGGVTDDEQGPYTLNNYYFQPCVVGDDRYEANNSPQQAAELDSEQPMHRYLRICEGKDDYFQLGLNEKDPRLHLGLALTAFPDNPDDPYLSDINVDHLSPTGDQILHAGQRPNEPVPGDVPLRSVLLTDKLTEEKALIRVKGEPDFYHLIQLNPSQPPPQPDQNQDEQEQNDSEQEEGDKPDPEDSENDDSQNEENQPPEDNPADEGEEEKKPNNQETAQPRDVSEDPEMERMEDILQALEDNDHNFQMKKALENMPNRYIERDW